MRAALEERIGDRPAQPDHHDEPAAEQQGVKLTFLPFISKAVTEACDSHGGFYLGSIGGPAARLAQDCIRSVEVVEYEELGMEAVWKIEVEDFPAFIVVDDKGNDFFTDPSGAVTVPISGIRVRSAQ